MKRFKSLVAIATVLFIVSLLLPQPYIQAAPSFQIGCTNHQISSTAGGLSYVDVEVPFGYQWIKVNTTSVSTSVYWQTPSNHWTWAQAGTWYAYSDAPAQGFRDDSSGWYIRMCPEVSPPTSTPQTTTPTNTRTPLPTVDPAIPPLQPTPDATNPGCYLIPVSNDGTNIYMSDSYFLQRSSGRPYAEYAIYGSARKYYVPDTLEQWPLPSGGYTFYGGVVRVCEQDLAVPTVSPTPAAPAGGCEPGDFYCSEAGQGYKLTLTASGSGSGEQIYIENHRELAEPGLWRFTVTDVNGRCRTTGTNESLGFRLDTNAGGYVFARNTSVSPGIDMEYIVPLPGQSYAHDGVVLDQQRAVSFQIDFGYQRDDGEDDFTCEITFEKLDNNSFTVDTNGWDRQYHLYNSTGLWPDKTSNRTGYLDLPDAPGPVLYEWEGMLSNLKFNVAPNPNYSAFACYTGGCAKELANGVDYLYYRSNGASGFYTYSLRYTFVEPTVTPTTSPQSAPPTNTPLTLPTREPTTTATPDLTATVAQTTTATAQAGSTATAQAQIEGTATAQAEIHGTATIQAGGTATAFTLTCADSPLDGLDCEIVANQQTQIALQQTALAAGLVETPALSPIPDLIAADDIAAATARAGVSLVLAEKEPFASGSRAIDAVSDIAAVLDVSEAPHCSVFSGLSTEFSPDTNSPFRGPVQTVELNQTFCFILDVTTTIRYWLRLLSLGMYGLAIIQYYMFTMRRIGDV